MFTFALVVGSFGIGFGAGYVAAAVQFTMGL
jgi:hypothetical protein